MPMIWDADADRKLLLAILKTQSVKVDSEAVAADLSTDTIKCTPRAVEEHLKKLKKMSADGNGGSADTSIGGEQVTSAKPKPKSKATPRRKKAVMDDDDDDEASPSKKPRRAGKSSKVETGIADAEDEALKEKLTEFVKNEEFDDEV